MPSIEAMDLNRLHLSVSRPVRRKKPRYRCSGCEMRTPRDHAKKNNGVCPHCGSVLRAWNT